MKPIFTTNAPKPAGHYSQAIENNGILYISGQLPINPQSGEKIQGSVEEQTIQTLRNIQAILETAGSNLGKLLKVNIYITDIGLWDRVNKIYAAFLGLHQPARTVVPVKELHYGFLIEIDAIASL